RRAAQMAAQTRCGLLLWHDFLFSRLLKLLRRPGSNQTRQVTLRGWPLCYRFNLGDLQSMREVIIKEVYACTPVSTDHHPRSGGQYRSSNGLFRPLLPISPSTIGGRSISVFGETSMNPVLNPHTLLIDAGKALKSHFS
ncbi:MAG: hypothetical protein JNG86_05085, partial [Verrucomicrobiaceae bacterium]|nr:hypothetical protein [Verrucomicrobiaceae bacterium]